MPDNIYDIIIIGAGMGGLSAGAFLAKEGKKVLVIEKHNKPGGLATSFTRKGCRFNIGIPYLAELGENGIIFKFLKYWEETLKTKKIEEINKTFIDNHEFIIDAKNAEKDLIKYFPHEEKAIKKFFSISSKIIDEIYNNPPPKPPYTMNFIEKIKFIINSIYTKPTFLKYAIKEDTKILKKIFKDKQLALILFGRYPTKFVFMGDVYSWEFAKRNLMRIPVNGIQDIPDAAASCINKHNGKVLLNTEINKIIIKNNKAIGVKDTNNKKYLADIVISNSPIHYTLNHLLKGINAFDKMRETISKRTISKGVMINFLGIDGNYDFKGLNHISILDNNIMNIHEKDFTPENCPIVMMILDKPKNQKNHSVEILAGLPAEYMNYWGTGKKNNQSNEYKKTKEKALSIIIDRVCEKMGNDFKKAIKFCISSTPLTLERYTYNLEGSFLGWELNEKQYGKFIPHITLINNLYFVGQWVFPSFGVSGVSASGFYVAETILQKEGINLKEKMKSFFNS